MRPNGRNRVLKNGLSFGKVVRKSRDENVESPCDHSEPIFCLPMLYYVTGGSYYAFAMVGRHLRQRTTCRMLSPSSRLA